MGSDRGGDEKVANEHRTESMEENEERIVDRFRDINGVKSNPGAELLVQGVKGPNDVK